MSTTKILPKIIGHRYAGIYDGDMEYLFRDLIKPNISKDGV